MHDILLIPISNKKKKKKDKQGKQTFIEPGTELGIFNNDTNRNIVTILFWHV